LIIKIKEVAKLERPIGVLFCDEIR